MEPFEPPPGSAPVFNFSLYNFASTHWHSCHLALNFNDNLVKIKVFFQYFFGVDRVYSYSQYLNKVSILFSSSYATFYSSI